MSYKFELAVRYAIEEMQGQAKRQPTTEDLNRYFTGCGGPFGGYDPTVSWCGIFATYILRLADVPVRWKMGVGMDLANAGGEVVFVSGNQGMGLGDVAVRGTHHFMVLDNEAPADGVILAVEGNYGGVGNPWLHHGYNPKSTVSAVQFYYRVY